MSQDPAKPDKRRNPRHDYRARAHASAHAEGENHVHAAIPDHPLIPKGQADLITTQAALVDLIAQLRAAGSFAYDSEFIGELSYHPKLCLIQVAIPSRISLIDPLAEVDLAQFWELLADPAIEKIVHAGEQDIEPVHRLTGIAAANLFDTQIAAGFIGLAYPVGLSKLVKEIIGVALGKGFTFTHWDQRPLSLVQMRYAADDVRYLPALRAEIGRRLENTGHAAWATEECQALCDPLRYEVDPLADFTRLRGATSLPPQNAAVLRELFLWREHAAHNHDTPPRSYLRDEILVDMARKPPTELEHLKRVKGLPRPVEAEEGSPIIEAVQRGLATPEEDRPILHLPEETPTERFAIDALWDLVQTWCHGRSIDPAIVASRNEIARFMRERFAGRASNAPILRGWRGELLGQHLLDFLASRKELTLRWTDGALRAVVSE